MTWSPRQRQMLHAMGLRLWSRAAPPSRAEAPMPAAAAPGDGREAVPSQAAAAASTHAAGPAASAPAVAAAPRAAVGTAAVADRGASTGDGRETPSAAPAVPALDARKASIERLDWPELRAAVAACQACDLHRTRRKPVFGVGHPQAHWMIVGEAPGEQEDLQGEPFVGAAGRLLDQMLAALALTRAPDGPQPPAQRVFIANTLKCRPPRNRNPEPGEMQACEPFLARQLVLVQPRIILAMGRFAIQSLLRTGEPVGKLRGRVHRCQGVPLVVTYHPAYLLRSPAEKARAWDDLCLAAQVVEEAGGGPAPVSPSSPSSAASRSAR